MRASSLTCPLDSRGHPSWPARGAGRSPMAPQTRRRSAAAAAATSRAPHAPPIEPPSKEQRGRPSEAPPACTAVRLEGPPLSTLMRHRGRTLVERRYDADTVEYAVCRSRRDAMLASWVPLLVRALVAAMLVAAAAARVCEKGTPPEEVDGDGVDGEAMRHARCLTSRWDAVAGYLLAAAGIAVMSAARVAASCVTSETLLVMRHVGVQLSTRRVLGGAASVFLERERISHAVVNEAVTVHDVFYYLCFRLRDRAVPAARGVVTDGCSGEKVVLVYAALRPGLPILQRVYVRVHHLMFGGEDEGGIGGRDAPEGVEGGEHDDAGVSGCTEGVYGGKWGGGTQVNDGGPQSVLMVSDFFLPNTGGVELHMYSLAQRLIQRGHKVTVLTHAYGDRCGVRYMTNGLKVYYAPRTPVYNGATCPDIFGNFKLLRLILLRERVTMLHAHQTFSVMGHEAVFHARTMGYKCVFTDHSLFGFHDASSIHMNKLLVMTLADCNHVVCVSHTAKENTVLRSAVPPQRVSVIPNAVDGARFTPDLSKRPRTTTSGRDRITVAVTARLAYRKGVHLLAGVIPLACARFPEVDFLIAGDGPMRKHLEEMAVEHGLTQRVTLLGNVAHANVSDVLQRAQIFLNCSLTESFCIAILEAACCGCLVVATNVGGVPEVLPPDLLFLADAHPPALVDALQDAMGALRGGGKANGRESKSAKRGKQRGEVMETYSAGVDPMSIHRRVAEMYSWDDVAARVEVVYKRAHATRDTLLGRLVRMHRCGLFAGKLFCCVVAVDYLYWQWVEWWRPAAEVERAPDFVPDNGCDFHRVDDQD